MRGYHGIVIDGWRIGSSQESPIFGKPRFERNLWHESIARQPTRHRPLRLPGESDKDQVGQLLCTYRAKINEPNLVEPDKNQAGQLLHGKTRKHSIKKLQFLVIAEFSPLLAPTGALIVIVCYYTSTVTF